MLPPWRSHPLRKPRAGQKPSDKCNLLPIEAQIGYNTNKNIPGGAAIAIL
ncbi:hypothetical protein KNP414_04249 [Paenibacillus mucilaginosus KNP414]|uniref:Uncharacterized protein n=1 Tax=Paenibacillus mucilaginosus (strain KNP414) TaxID=1036673 RepID=F8FHS4_PAEMK|nr:hypothetical protein KNP414_04249 [Paenibacillus mucilaginosus KNP414]